MQTNKQTIFFICRPQGSECPEREVICPYCQLSQKAKDQKEHEGYCGSRYSHFYYKKNEEKKGFIVWETRFFCRTEKCEECGDFVMLKDWEEHEKMTLYHGTIIIIMYISFPGNNFNNFLPELAKKPCSQVFGYEPLKTVAAAPGRKISAPSVRFAPSSSSSSSSSSNLLRERKFSLQNGNSSSNNNKSSSDGAIAAAADSADATARLISRYRKDGQIGAERRGCQEKRSGK